MEVILKTIEGYREQSYVEADRVFLMWFLFINAAMLKLLLVKQIL
jgi:hypothetical protein